MKINRRQFLSYLGAVSVAPALMPLSGCGVQKSPQPLFATGYKIRPESGLRQGSTGYNSVPNEGSREGLIEGPKEGPKEGFGVIGFDGKGDLQFDVAVNDEVHLAKVIPSFSRALKNQSLLIVNSRKPYAPLAFYDLKGTLLGEINPPNNMNFEGHFIEQVSNPGSESSSALIDLFVSAQHNVSHQGKVVHYQVKFEHNSLKFHKVADFDTAGIGSHEMVWMDDQRIAIANTGVATHPESDQQILNPKTIHSNISILNIATGKITNQYDVGLPGLSARHLAKLTDGRLLIGLQYRLSDKRPPAVGFVDQNGFKLVENLDEKLHWDMQAYTASVTAIPSTGEGLISNPRGHLLTQWKQPDKNGTMPESNLKFVKGIAFKNNHQALITVGAGEVWQYDVATEEMRLLNTKLKPGIWLANHLMG